MFQGLASRLMAVTAALGILASPAAAQEPLTLGFASAFSKTHWLWTQGGAVFAKAVEDGTGGKVRFLLFPGGQLGKETVGIISTGLAASGILVPSYEPAKLPLTSVAELPGFHASACEGTAKAWHLMQEGGAVYEAELKPLGLMPLYVNVLTPYQLVTTRKTVATLQDVAGLKLRANGAAMDGTARAIGSVPVMVSSTEFYDALTRGTIDGGLWPIGSTVPAGLDGVIRHTLRGARLGGGVTVLAISAKVWDGLDAATRQVMRAAGEQAQRHLCAYLDALDQEVTDKLVAAGTLEVVDLPDAEQPLWAERVAAVGQKWASLLDATGRPGTAVLNAYSAAPASF